jgi:AraC family L-rhamnose operon regulatory protein RhaS
VSHAIEDNPVSPLALYAVCVARDVIRYDPGLFERLPVGAVRVGSAIAGEARATFRKLLFEQTRQRPLGPTLIIGLSMQLMAALGRISTVQRNGEADDEEAASAAQRRQAVERYIADLSHRFFERTTLDGAAAELGMSRRRLTTLFFEITGQTWADYVTALRVEYACKLLCETTRSVVAIAFECGYEDLSSFYRSFKRQTGRSPGQWRERQRRA